MYDFEFQYSAAVFNMILSLLKNELKDEKVTDPNEIRVVASIPEIESWLGERFTRQPKTKDLRGVLEAAKWELNAKTSFHFECHYISTMDSFVFYARPGAKKSVPVCDNYMVLGLICSFIPDMPGDYAINLVNEYSAEDIFNALADTFEKQIAGAELANYFTLLLCGADEYAYEYASVVLH